MIVFAATACGNGNGKGAANVAETQEEALPKVSVVGSVRRMVPQTGTYTSTVQANVVNNIAPQSASRIKKVNVEIGDFVSAGVLNYQSHNKGIQDNQLMEQMNLV